MHGFQGVDCGAEGCSICLFGYPIDSSGLAPMCTVNFCSSEDLRSPGFESAHSPLFPFVYVYVYVFDFFLSLPFTIFFYV